MARLHTQGNTARDLRSRPQRLDDVAILLDRFVSRASRSRLPPFVRLARIIRRHRDGIIAAVRLGTDNARAEALNNKVRLTDHPPRLRLPHPDAALAAIMLACGPITLSLPHELHLR